MDQTPLAKAMAGKVTDRQLADLLGVDRSFVTKLRNRDRRLSLEMAAKIAASLDVPLETLVEPQAA